MRRVTDLIIAKEYAEGDVPGVGNLTENNWVDGKVTVLKEDMTELVAADTTYDGPIFISRYDRRNNLRLSLKLQKRGIKLYEYKLSNAEDAKVVSIPMPASPVVGESYGFYVIDIHDREVVYNGRKLIYVQATTTSQTDLRDALIAAVNSYPGDTLTVAADANGTSVRLTAQKGRLNKTLEGYERIHSFEVALYAGLIGQTITVDTAHDLGCGEFEEVYNIENDADLGYRGHLNRVMYQDQPERYAESGCLYNMYAIEHNLPGEDTVSDNANSPRPATTIIAFKAASEGNPGTGEVAFKALLDNYMGLSIDNLEDDAE